MQSFNMSKRTLHLVCAWCGLACTAVCLTGLLIAGLIPPPHPDNSVNTIAARYVEDKDQIRIGMFIAVIGFTLYGPWGAEIASRLRPSEGDRPVLAYTQVAMLGTAIFVGVLFSLMIGVAAFRPGEVSPDVTTTVNDIAWFLFLFDWPPFAVWCVAIGVAIMKDKREVPSFPRWAAYLNFWCAFLDILAGFVIFFKGGPLAYDGVLAYWIPLVIFFVWIVIMTYLLIVAINREADADEAGQAAATGAARLATGSASAS
ncbi:hypothetical protein MycrhDRAFT_1562 [Mycolicibacterium rhodesiae JS60]|nr:hypothetical protein MycrhDRAFT_1562 [Mycolicibacterium rhodesiae JS60]